MDEYESQAAALESCFSRDPKLADRASRLAVFRAMPGDYLDRFDRGQVSCLQSSKPLADPLSRLGFDPLAPMEGPVSLAIVFATKHKEEVLYHVAQAVERLEEGGLLMVSAANDLGAASLERRCGEALGHVESYSKHKCRVFRAVKDSARLDKGILSAWLEAGALRRVPATGLYACPGLFSWKTIDAGSRLLAAHLPGDLAGRGADLGAGYGYLSREALALASGISELHLFEAEKKALEAAELNLADSGSSRTLHYHWEDVTAGLPVQGLDFVLMNPPFHAGRGVMTSLGRAFIAAALAAAKPGGRVFMVANRHLPYEAEIQATGAQIDSVIQKDGFKFLQVRKSR